MSNNCKYDLIDEKDLQSIHWMSGSDEDWLKDFGYIPMPENLIQEMRDDCMWIWSDEYPEEGYLEIYPPHMIGDNVDGQIVESVKLYRDPEVHNNNWLFKTIFKKV